jgi:hypothetical protein
MTAMARLNNKCKLQTALSSERALHINKPTNDRKKIWSDTKAD